jgi:hypothetical protein
MLFFALWAYRMVVKTTTSFTPFHLVHGVEATLPIECEIPTLHTPIELLPETTLMEQCLLNLDSLDEYYRSSLQNNEAAKKWSKATFDHSTKATSSFLTISLTIPSSMESSSDYGMELTSSNIASLNAHTCWPLPKATPLKNPSTGCT